MFQIGDLVEITSDGFIRPRMRQYIGMQAEVVSGLIRNHEEPYYRIHVSNGEHLYATPRVLRKIPPKQNWVKLCQLDVREAVTS